MIDGNCAKQLQTIGYPNAQNQKVILDVLSKMQCFREEYLILDNFMDFHFPNIEALLETLEKRKEDGLHIAVVLTRMSSGATKILPSYRSGIIGKECFEFDIEDIKSYFRQVGLQISQEEIQKVYDYSQGWIAALYLQMMSFLDNGTFSNNTVEELLRQVVWERLEDTEKDILLSVSMFPDFTLEQAIFLSGQNEQVTRNLIVGNGFIHYEREKQNFYPHAILEDFLKKRFAVLPEEEKKKYYQRAAVWAKEHGDRQNTLKFYYMAGEREAIYSLKLTSYEIADILDDVTTPMVLDLLENTPREIKIKYPEALIPLAFALFFLGKNKELLMSERWILEIISESAISTKEKNALQGEMELLLSFLEYNRIDDMGRRHKRALELLGGPARLIHTKSTWTFGSPSVLYMFWREVGGLSRELEQMDECMPIYYQLTNGHGSGAELVMRAEERFYSGNLQQAEFSVIRPFLLQKVNCRAVWGYVLCFCLHASICRRGLWSS